MAPRKYPNFVAARGYTWKLIDPKFGQYKAYYDTDCNFQALINHLPAYGDYKWLKSQQAS